MNDNKQPKNPRSRWVSLEPVKRAAREHWHFVLVVGALTALMTFPTILYVFRTDVFWIPAGGTDVFTEFWDVWYGGQFLSGLADRFHTNKVFYPLGVSLNHHPINLPYVLLMNVLSAVMPLSNAFSLMYMLIIVACAASAYFYLNFIFSNTWIALLGAVVFGFSPHVIGHPNHPNNALVATIPLTMYFLHRGISEERARYCAIAGTITGLTSIINIYAYVCLLLSIALMVCAFAVKRWRVKTFWYLGLILIICVGVASAWRILPMLVESQARDATTTLFRGSRNDLVSNFVNHQHPLIGPIGQSILETPDHASRSATSYLGYVVLILTAAALLSKPTRIGVAPWLLLAGFFLLLRLGWFLSINGSKFATIPMPKLALDQLLPVVFRSFRENDDLMMGAILPLAVSACYGLAALNQRFPRTRRAAFILFLIVLTAFEYFIPIRGTQMPLERFDYLLWQNDEESFEGACVTINVPMGRFNSEPYNLHQALGSCQRVEGAISRTPDSAFIYIRENALLSAWHEHRAITCDATNRETYLKELGRLEEDGISHVVHHYDMRYASHVEPSFRNATAAYSDDFVSIYRLQALRESCPQA